MRLALSSRILSSLVVGRWPSAVSAVARMLDVDSAGGAGDRCCGISSPVATVKPDAGQRRVGARWDMQFSNGHAGC